MKKKFSAVTALTLTLAMVLTACSGGGGGETTAAAGGDTKAAGETTQAAAPSGDAVKMTMGTGGTTGTYYAFGGVIANVLNAKDIGVTLTSSPPVRPRPTSTWSTTARQIWPSSRTMLWITPITELTCSRKRARQQNLPQSLVFTQRSARWSPPAISSPSRI